MRLVTFSGVDGSAKSTQIELLTGRLRAAGEEPSVVWFRPGYSPRLDRLRAEIRRASPTALPKPGANAERELAFRHSSVRWGWLAVALVDATVEYAWSIRRLLAAGRSVLADRWIWDSALDLAIRYPELRCESIEAVCAAVAPRPDCSLLLQVAADEAERRRRGKNEPFPDSPEVADRRCRAYDALAARPDIHVVDAGRAVDLVHRDIVQLVLRA